jgi:predicted CoA-binding protein
MTAHHNHLEVIRALLTTPATWAVVGLSDNEGRTAYWIAQWLRVRLDMQVLPIHPSAPFDPPVLGSPGYAALAAIPDGVRVAVVDCFVRSELVGAVVDEAIAQRERLGIGAVWLQLGVIDEAAAARAEAAGLAVVMDTCPRIEWPRL